MGLLSHRFLHAKPHHAKPSHTMPATPCRIWWWYETSIETVKRIDPVAQKLILERKVGIAGSNAEIKVDDILEIYSDELIDTAD